jgi:hypothetical protein
MVSREDWQNSYRLARDGYASNKLIEPEVLKDAYECLRRRRECSTTEPLSGAQQALVVFLMRVSLQSSED